MQIKVFDYIAELDCFVIRKEFREIVERLRVTEWTPVVWICRLLALDNDFGEHIFDNWDERENLAKKAAGLGYDDEDLMIVVPERFTDHDPFCIHCSEGVDKAYCPKCGEPIYVGPDGPCHSDAQRKRFWTDVFKCLTLDLETIFEEARWIKLIPVPEDEPFDLEEEITKIKQEYRM